MALAGKASVSLKALNWHIFMNWLFPEVAEERSPLSCQLAGISDNKVEIVNDFLNV